MLTASLDSVFYFRCTSLNARLPPQSSRQCFTKRAMSCANSGGLVGAGLGDFVLELAEDLDLEGPCVSGNSGLGVSVVSAAFLTFLVSLHIHVLGEFNSQRWS